MRSFTLVEILVVIAIAIILMALAIPSYRFFQREVGLNNSVEEIIKNLRVAQNKTLVSEGASQYGVYFDQVADPHQYTLFKGVSYNLRDSSFDEVYKLPISIEIYEINLVGGGSEIVFNRIIGDTSQAGNLILRLINEPSKVKTIYIENSGQVGLSVPVIPSDDRVKDARHVHFDLGWSIQNANILKFSYPDIPQTEQVDMASYFNFDKTEFNWQGAFTIGGTGQSYQIHTHSLGTFNTVLCIHRNRNQGENNQKVIIYIVDGGSDKEIASYLANDDDTVNVGASGGAKEIQ